jgi:hypothetical protein
MRSMLVLYSVFAVFLMTSACDNGADPDEVPRTVPPTAAPAVMPVPEANDMPTIDAIVVIDV